MNWSGGRLVVASPLVRKGTWSTGGAAQATRYRRARTRRARSLSSGLWKWPMWRRPTCVWRAVVRI